MSDDSNLLDDIVTQAALLPWDKLQELAKRIIAMVQVRTPESVLRAGEQAVDVAIDAVEDAKFD